MSARPSVKLLRALLDESADGLLAVDAKGHVLTANAAASGLFGFGPEKIEGKHLEDLVPPVSRRPLRELLAKGEGRLETFLSGRRTEIRVRRLEDGVLLVRLRTQPRSRADAGDSLGEFLFGFPHGVVRVGNDGKVTFANPLAKVLFRPQALVVGRPLPEPWPSISLATIVDRARRSRIGLAPRIADAGSRTLRIFALPPVRDEGPVLVLEDVTRQHRRDRVNSEFVRNAAHQMRTPTAAIASAVEVLQGGAKEIPAERDRFLAHLERETNRLVRLMQALLVLARAEAGVQPPRLEFVRLEPLLQDVAGGAYGPEHRVELTCDPSIAVFVERDLAEQAFQSIVENALQHARGGTVRINAWDSGAGRVTVEVDDPGEGILPEHLERVQEPFYRGAVDRDGFGLGLAIAAQAINAVGGTLRIASSPGQGTKATIELPSAQIREAS